MNENWVDTTKDASQAEATSSVNKDTAGGLMQFECCRTCRISRAKTRERVSRHAGGLDSLDSPGKVCFALHPWVDLVDASRADEPVTRGTTASQTACMRRACICKKPVWTQRERCHKSIMGAVKHSMR
jgi:hypothetical protein